MTYFAYFLKDLGLDKKVIGIDNLSGAGGKWGYKGSPIVKMMPKARFVEARDIVESMRIIKSSEEITLIRESARWGNLAHTLLQEFTGPGLWDYDIAMRASREASLIMKKTLGLEYQTWRNSGSPASAGFRGQIGSMSAIPHAMSTKKRVKNGDVIISGAGADVGGYNSELERTMIVGEPTAKQKRFFEVMLKAQDAALAAFKPGAKCSDVDRKASEVIQKADWALLMRHHTGHGIGLEGHEPPWLDIGDNTVMKPGMVFSCEPGIYKTGFAGFRHSDTVVITEDGSERITYYPRDLESLTI
jgi:Xaa-Pro aminopeptidase